MGDPDSLRELPDLLGKHGGVEQQIGDRAAMGAKQVGVLLEVCAKTRRFALVVDGSNDARLCEGFEAIVDGGERDRGHFGLHSHENVHGTRVIRGFHQGLEDGLTLFGLTERFFWRAGFWKREFNGREHHDHARTTDAPYQELF